MLLSYTVSVNLLVTILRAIFLKVDEPFRVKSGKDPTLLRLKGGVTMSIMITCVIYHFMLARLRQIFTVWKISFATISFPSGF